MRYLLDTHALLWALGSPGELSTETAQVLESDESSIYVSIASLWECSIKSSIGKLNIPPEFYDVAAATFVVLPIEVGHLVAYPALPMHHRDPFDRMLVVQARLGDLVLVTRDAHIKQYDVKVLEA